MKATGVVRRIEAGVIKTPRATNTHEHYGFRAIFEGKFLIKR